MSVTVVEISPEVEKKLTRLTVLLKKPPDSVIRDALIYKINKLLKEKEVRR